MIGKDFCLSSYMAYRYVYKEGVDFFEGLEHKNIPPRNVNELIKIKTSEDIGRAIQDMVDQVYEQYSNPAILLSGGMDSSIVASYLRPGARAYTFCSKDTEVFDQDVARAKQYVNKFGFIHSLVDISYDDYKELVPRLMMRKQSPTHSIEPQILKAALQAKADGADILLIGDSSDYVFGGMDKLLSKDWTYNDFIKRYYTVDPELVLVSPVDVSGLLKPYDRDGVADVNGVLLGPALEESIGSYDNAINEAGLPYLDPYEYMIMEDPLDISRVRNGESKYLIRALYKSRYPEFDIPEKIPMPRPVDYIFSNWEGPKRKEFRQDIDMGKLTGNQKWQLWCAEQFLNQFDI